jgi:hypothetical protein
VLRALRALELDVREGDLGDRSAVLGGADGVTEEGLEVGFDHGDRIREARGKR